MKKFIFAVLMVLCCMPQAQAYLINATVTADNHYALYAGNADGSILSDYFFRNENTPEGQPGQYNWSLPENFSFVTPEGADYLYLVAWNEDNTSPAAWIGQFFGDGIYPIYSNALVWESAAGTGENNSSFGGDILVSALQNDIANAQWQVPEASAPNGSSPWGTIPGVSSKADFIWHDSFDGSNVGSNTYAIFRTQPIPTPEPATMVLFGIGLAGLGVLRRKQFKA